MQRKVAKWFKTADLFEDAEKLYRTEYWSTHNAVRFLDEAEVRQLIATLCETFNVPLVKTTFSLHDLVPEGKKKDWIANFTVAEDGKLWFHFRLTAEPTRVFKRRAITRRCEKVWLKWYNVPRGTAMSHTVTHEFAHYLCYVWWGHAPHDWLFASVLDAVNSWYSRSRPKTGTKCKLKVMRKAQW